EPLATPFLGVITFNDGGTVAEFGVNPNTPYRTPGHGIWATEGGQGRFTFIFSFLPLTPAGAPVGRMRVTQIGDLTRGSDVSTSDGSFAPTNLAGTVIATGCTTSVAVRVN